MISRLSNNEGYITTTALSTTKLLKALESLLEGYYFASNHSSRVFKQCHTQFSYVHEIIKMYLESQIQGHNYLNIPTFRYHYTFVKILYHRVIKIHVMIYHA